MILTRPQIMRRIKQKQIKINPFDKSAIGPASVDLSLGNELRVFNPGNSVILLSESDDYKKITKKVDISKGYVLRPHELVFGITKEKITLPGNICGWLQSRSRFARFGLMSHITAPFICPGVSNHQVLEIFNAGSHKLELMPGMKLCQIIFQLCKGEARYKGIFKDQEL